MKNTRTTIKLTQGEVIGFYMLLGLTLNVVIALGYVWYNALTISGLQDFALNNSLQLAALWLISSSIVLLFLFREFGFKSAVRCLKAIWFKSKHEL